MELTWRSLNDQLSTMDEERVLSLLDAERAGARRVSMLQRLHQRYCALRDARERMEILKEAERP